MKGVYRFPELQNLLLFRGEVHVVRNRSHHCCLLPPPLSSSLAQLSYRQPLQDTAERTVHTDSRKIYSTCSDKLPRIFYQGTVQLDPTYPDVIVTGTLVYRGPSARSAINARSNAHAHYHLIFEFSESVRSRGMASVTHKHSVVTLERKLDVIRMLRWKISAVCFSSTVFRVMDIFTHTGTCWSHAARISEV